MTRQARMLDRLNGLVQARRIDAADANRTAPHRVPKPAPVDHIRTEVPQHPPQARIRDHAQLYADPTNLLGNPEGVTLYTGKTLRNIRPASAMDNGTVDALPTRGVLLDYENALEKFMVSEGDSYVPAPRVPEPRWYTWPGRRPVF